MLYFLASAAALLPCLLTTTAAPAAPLSVSPTLSSSGVLAAGVPLSSLWGYATPGAAVAAATWHIVMRLR